ncbi:MAG: nucleotide exchange factor GrpE [Fusobacteriota bacterium]
MEEKETKKKKDEEFEEGIEAEEVEILDEDEKEEEKEKKKEKAQESKEELTEKEKHKKEAQKWKELYARKAAEFENRKKRMERDQKNFEKYATEKVIIKVLEAVDNLDRAINSSKENQDFESLVKGVEMTLRQMHKMLKDEGVEEIEAEGEEFDPRKHHAMMQEKNEEYDHNTVIQELQKGYKMKDKVIRPTLVKVAKNK